MYTHCAVSLSLALSLYTHERFGGPRVGRREKRGKLGPKRVTKLTFSYLALDDYRYSSAAIFSGNYFISTDYNENNNRSTMAVSRDIIYITGRIIDPVMCSTHVAGRKHTYTRYGGHASWFRAKTRVVHR